MTSAAGELFHVFDARRVKAPEIKGLDTAANALVGLKDEWREVAGFHSVEGRRFKLFEYLGD